MVQINFGQREVSCKVVYYGPAMSGKTTNIEWIHSHSPQANVGDLVSIKTTETDRTLYFDFLPLDLGQVGGMRTKFKLYTVPGQVYYNATRKLVLQGADGVVFIADSRPERMADNIEALLNLRLNLEDLGLPIERVPLVLQYNLRDMPNAMSFQDMDAKLNPRSMLPVYSGVARDGTGVFSCLKEVSRLVIDRINKMPAPERQTLAQERLALLTPPSAPVLAFAGAAAGAAGAPSGASGYALSQRVATFAPPAPHPVFTPRLAPVSAAPTDAPRPGQDRVSSSTTMPVMRSAVPVPAPKRPPTPSPPPALATAPVETGSPLLVVLTILGAVVVVVAIIAGIYVLFPPSL